MTKEEETKLWINSKNVTVAAQNGKARWDNVFSWKNVFKQLRIQLKSWTKTMEQLVLSMAKRIREKVPAYTGSKP